MVRTPTYGPRVLVCGIALVDDVGNPNDLFFRDTGGH